ncbi:efflux RND transporter periplasmic adaptor subunit [Salegentibacter chungangensis]|uniref:Efflux RND transporter periplasmic adaptor subunit n=1 Tax=Salegentibacter chungangensis TaxID=1335724 RepID=A0ABW3NLR1_9FLAO
MNRYLSGLLAIILASGLFACKNDGGKAQANQSAQAPSYPVIKIERRDVTTYSEYPASLEGEVSSEVRPKISGYIKDVLVHEGEEVRKGQVLFRLETQSLSQDAAASRANVNAAQVEVNKLKPLVEKDIISPVQLETAKARLEQAKSNYNSIAANIDYANVKSPVDGVVGSINYRKGALAGPQDAKPLTRVSSIKKVYAYFSMNEKNYLNFIKNAEGKNQQERIEKLPKVKLVLANGEEYTKAGSIETIAGDIDPQTGTVTFRALFDNSEGLLRNGSSGTVLVPENFQNALVVPAFSSFEQQGKKMVYKVRADSLSSASIQVLAETGKLYVVDQGIKEGETILAKGVSKVRDGTRIKPQPVSMDSILNSFDTVFK